MQPLWLVFVDWSLAIITKKYYQFFKLLIMNYHVVITS